MNNNKNNTKSFGRHVEPKKPEAKTLTAEQYAFIDNAVHKEVQNFLESQFEQEIENLKVTKSYN